MTTTVEDRQDTFDAAPGSIVVVRDEEWLVTNVERASDGWFVEFARVAIFGAGEGSIPASYLLKNMNDAERSDVLLRERSLLYVAATRARDELVVIWAGEPSNMVSSAR